MLFRSSISTLDEELCCRVVEGGNTAGGIRECLTCRRAIHAECRGDLVDAGRATESGGETLADASRSISTLDDTTAEFLVAEGALPEESILESEQLGMLRAAVDALPEKMRHVVTRIYFEDQSVKELAEELGTTHSAVSQTRAEAIRLLKDGMQTHYADDPEVMHAPESRIAAASRNAYLSRLADSTAVGISRFGYSQPAAVRSIA